MANSRINLSIILVDTTESDFSIYINLIDLGLKYRIDFRYTLM
jgi:hypothetical protein